MFDEIKRQGKALGILLLMPLIIPLVIVFLLVVFLILLPLSIMEEKKRKRKVNGFLQEHDYTYFFIYSSGKKKAAIYEKHIVPTLNPGVKVVKFNGMKYDSFFIPETYYQVINPSEQGYPIIGKIEEGKVYIESLKEEFSQLVLKEKEVKRFIEILHQKIDAL